MNEAELILEAKEDRFLLQKALVKQYHQSLVSIKANYPGSHKNNLLSTYLVIKSFIELRSLIDICFYQIISSYEGIVVLIISKSDSHLLKKMMIDYEEKEEVNRLLDIDVYSNEYEVISRRLLNIKSRSCFICDEDAKQCNRSQKHSYEELQSYFNDLVIKDIFSNKQLLYYKLSIYGLSNELNKPINYGCVGFNHNGAHQDMDYYTFIDSMTSISNDFKYFSNIELSFDHLRAFGIVMEEHMFKATKNINTHQGAIFSLLFLFAGIALSNEFNDITSNIKKLAIPLKADFTSNDIPEHLSFYLKNNIMGARGLALSGYQVIFEEILPYYDKVNELDELMNKIVSIIEDTNIIKRSNLDTYQKIKSMAFKANTKKDIRAIDEYCLSNNISCGGSADIYALSLILILLKKYQKQGEY
ncbi:MAG: citrate lyase holo-[acyl-carrier protein] synthase [Bacilli bacterium]|jgi:holo-ACP synthase/triphosphoribosyl-dephospho-CoA synthase|nr:citrate lyase holo-[acyl-carrier protein] synthase [Bacilli bacterium]